MKKVLVIESKKDMSKRIVDMLQEEKYETYVIVNKIDNMNHIQFKAFDIILLNVELLQKEDIRILKKIVENQIPVIVLLDRIINEGIVKILKDGNNDYIIKPFKKVDLLARIHLRLKDNDNEIYQYRDITINTNQKIVYKNNKRIDLTLKEYELFLLFVKNLDIILPRKEILSRVWGINVELQTRTIDYHIQQLRRKLGLKDNIVTINKIGYYLKGEKIT